MNTRKVIITVMAFMLTAITANAQLFETRSTRYSGDSILTKFNAAGSAEQVLIRDSMVLKYSKTLRSNEVIETFYDDYHLGLVIYKDGKPHNLIGFWNPKGEQVYGGNLVNGTGIVETPFNRDLIVNFTNESVQYIAGMKKGPVFYFCDCAHVLRRGTFNNNVKEGLWEEFAPSGEFIKKKRIKVVDIPDEPDPILKDDKWLLPAHCMMRNPDDKEIICPKK